MSNEEIGIMNVDYDCMLTTFDNPFDPIDQFDSWFQYDIEKGYNTCERLARFANTSDQLTEKENNEEIERAIDEIVAIDFLNVYKKVKKEIVET